ncbi:MAG: efflux RND transporter permease subunit [Bacteroides cellulosilyticus]
MHSEAQRRGRYYPACHFDFGTNTDLAFIEVNEKIDAAMNYLPKETERPKVIKASATDIPVFYLNLTLKNDSAYGAYGQQSLSSICVNLPNRSLNVG